MEPSGAYCGMGNMSSGRNSVHGLGAEQPWAGSLSRMGRFLKQKKGSGALAVAVSIPTVGALVGCGSAEQHSGNGHESVSSNYEGEGVPCWLSNPVNSKGMGTIGISSRFGHGGTYELSRKRAINGLLGYLGFSEIEDESELKGKSSWEAGNETIHLAPTWKHASYYYSYAYIGQDEDRSWAREECEPAECDMDACEPEWLCVPQTGDGKVRLRTISHISTGPAEQYRHLFDNAGELLRAVHGVGVEARRELFQKERITQGSSEANEWFWESSQISFEKDSSEPKLLLEKTCMKGSSMYGLVRAEGVEGVNVDALESVSPDWHQDGYEMSGSETIGSFQGYLSINTISNMVDMAVQDGLVNLALEKRAQVSVDEVIISNTAGVYSARVVTEGADIDVHAIVKDVIFKGGGKNPNVLVLLETLIE